MKRLLIPVLVVVANLSAVDAIAVFDQWYYPITMDSRAHIGSSNGVDWAQTFTVGITGEFSGFDIWVSRGANTTLPLLFDIRRTEIGRPTEADSGVDILAAGTIDAARFDITTGSPPDSIPRVDLKELAFNVVAGEVLALTLRSDAPSTPSELAYEWHGDTFGQYANGAAYFRTSGLWGLSSSDRGFKTFVGGIPEPTNWTLAILAIVSLGIYKPRRA